MLNSLRRRQPAPVAADGLPDLAPLLAEYPDIATASDQLSENANRRAALRRELVDHQLRLHGDPQLQAVVERPAASPATVAALGPLGALAGSDGEHPSVQLARLRVRLDEIRSELDALDRADALLRDHARDARARASVAICSRLRPQYEGDVAAGVAEAANGLWTAIRRHRAYLTAIADAGLTAGALDVLPLAEGRDSFVDKLDTVLRQCVARGLLKRADVEGLSQ